MACLVIADDSDLLRRTIRNFLFDYPRFEIAGEARDHAQTLALVAKVQPDVLMLDLRMPGVESVPKLRNWPRPAIAPSSR
jgi:DNA-binding NarL/FixJ family response regulator